MYLLCLRDYVILILKKCNFWMDKWDLPGWAGLRCAVGGKEEVRIFLLLPVPGPKVWREAGQA